jgi:hypothetical protein
MLDFSSLKKKSGQSKDMLKKAIDEQSKSYKADERIWSCQRDKSGNGEAVIRFLPSPSGEDYPWVKYYEHVFKNETTSKWYIEKSLTSIGQPDPLSDYNTKLWNTGIESNKEIVRSQKRNVRYVSNILVINDYANPENNGKVFLFKYGTKIFERIKLALNPEFESDTPFDPFDFWEGANFKLKIRKVSGQINYDNCSWDKQSPVADSDEKLEAIWKQQHSLQEFLDPKTFKTYEELQKRMNLVLGLNETVQQTSIPETKAPEPKEEVAPEPKVAEAPKIQEKQTKIYDDLDDDDVPDYFANLKD